MISKGVTKTRVSADGILRAKSVTSASVSTQQFDIPMYVIWHVPSSVASWTKGDKYKEGEDVTLALILSQSIVLL